MEPLYTIIVNISDHGYNVITKNKPGYHIKQDEWNTFNESTTDGVTNVSTFVFDPSKYPYPGQIRHIEIWEIILKIALYGIIILTALIGNTAVILTVVKIRRMRTTTNFYILNLAVCDVMVTLTCTWVHLVDDLTEGWVLGAFFCKINSFSQGK